MHAGDRLSTLASTRHVESYYFVLLGQLAVERTASYAASARGNACLLLLEPGDHFSDAHLGLGAEHARLHVDCVASTETHLDVVERPALVSLMRRYPDLDEALREKNALLRNRRQRNSTQGLRVVQDFFRHHNLCYAKTTKVIDLDACIGCDGCERACRDRHGFSRIVRNGPSLGRLAFPVACRDCIDSRCLFACGFDAISKDDHGAIRIDAQKCAGCRACHDACPNAVITMLDAPYTKDDFPNPLPWTNAEGQTNVPGLYLAGEATGTALIKLAINAGRAAIDAIVRNFDAHPTVGAIDPEAHTQSEDAFYVAIVGAGPAGLVGRARRKDEWPASSLRQGTFRDDDSTYPRESS